MFPRTLSILLGIILFLSFVWSFLGLTFIHGPILLPLLQGLILMGDFSSIDRFQAYLSRLFQFRGGWFIQSLIAVVFFFSKCVLGLCILFLKFLYFVFVTVPDILGRVVFHTQGFQALWSFRRYLYSSRRHTTSTVVNQQTAGLAEPEFSRESSPIEGGALFFSDLSESG